jgi:hypothetical protein
MPLPSVLRRALLLALLAFLAIGCVTDERSFVDADATPRRSAAAADGVGVSFGGNLVAYEAWLGHPVTHVGVYASQQSWAAFDRSRWDALRGLGKHLVVGVPLLVRSQPGTLAAGAAGAYDAHFRQLAERLVEDGQADAILRLGWGFNGRWSLWRADRDPSAFAAYWRRVVTVMRTVPGAVGLRFDWNPDLGAVPTGSYPGDAYVDVIGATVYDRTSDDQRRDPDERWDDLVHRPYGLDWLRDFATAHAKPLSIPEWALTHQHAPGVDPDNPAFVRGMAELVRSSNVEYQLYFNALTNNGDFRITTFPRSAEAYREAF